MWHIYVAWVWNIALLYKLKLNQIEIYDCLHSQSVNFCYNVAQYTMLQARLVLLQHCLISKTLATAYLGKDVTDNKFLHDWPWISPWIKSISDELDLTCHVLASLLYGHCEVIADRLWRHRQNVMRASQTQGLCVKILIIDGFIMSCKE